MERHAILDSIDVMPEIYDILRHCEESHLTADEKSLLATQLAPHWTNSEEARRALETAVVYTEAEEEAEFWQGLQVQEKSGKKKAKGWGEANAIGVMYFEFIRFDLTYRSVEKNDNILILFILLFSFFV